MSQPSPVAEVRAEGVSSRSAVPLHFRTDFLDAVGPSIHTINRTLHRAKGVLANGEELTLRAQVTRSRFGYVGPPGVEEVLAATVKRRAGVAVIWSRFDTLV